ncbi:MAG: N-acetyl-gamma-glutamyl-phosphate reductase [Candidatus Omnitrophica bacterium]|nr:N-acetyl-gamma-glutamyl-phosphate reductase [Candidatus Omnitrophota bacterium]
MLKVGVIGATGYTGEELVKILLNHPKVELTSITAKVEKESRMSDLFGRFLGKCDLMCKNLDVDEVAKKTDLVFLALPHGVSMQYAKAFLKKGKRVIDLSADYRLSDASLYKEWYHIKHTDEVNLAESVYGMPEVYKSQIKEARLVANPGCYPTVSILSSLPMAARHHLGLSGIIIDAKSGITGAGRKAALGLHYSEINESIKAYKINEHQHIPEINQELTKARGSRVDVTFVPHVVPLNRGILATVYMMYREKVRQDDVLSIYKDYYKKAPFVRVLDEGRLPEIKDVVYTNYCHIGLKVNEEKGLVIAVAVIDNLLKGASGQAVQDMNIMNGFNETEGLI